MTFMTVEQLQAQIASLTAENERLRKDMPVSFVNLVFDVSRLTAENERLREALKALQRQVLQGAVRGDEWMDEALELTRAALQYKEGDQ